MPDPPRARVGILGGTFDPPHRGHVAIALCAREQLRLERVLLMPVHDPPHRLGERHAAPGARLEMCRLAAAGQAGLGVCELEVRRGGASFTVDTLSAIHASHPNTELTFVLGADSALTLPSWRDPGSVVRLADLAVAGREGLDPASVLAAIEPLAEAAERPVVSFLDLPRIDVSASLVRERVAAGEPVAELVGPAVADYIEEHGLYRAVGS